MESILYVGATLMIGASIYGFVDYKQTHRKKEFKEMYTEDVSKTPVDVTTETKITEPVEKKDIVVINKKTETKKQVAAKKTEKKLVKKKKKINSKIFSRAPIREEINFASEEKTTKKSDKQ